MTLYIPVAIPGTGKSYYAERLQEGNPNLWVGSADDIRAEKYGSADIQGDGKYIVSILEARVREHLSNGNDVYIDMQNLNRFARKLWVDIGKEFGATIIAVYWKPDTELAIKQNAERKRHVPVNVILRNAKRIQKPTAEEGFSEIIYK